MVYEWDEKRARRAHLTKIGLNLLAVLAIIAVPALVAASMIG